MQGIMKQLQAQQNSLQLQQDFFRYQDKEGFHFRGDADDYPALLMVYNEKTKHITSDKERFDILYTLLDGEAEKAYNLHIANTDKSEALKYVWCNLKDNFGYRNQHPLVNVDERSACSLVESTLKGLRTLLGNLCYCRNRAGREHANHLNSPAFLGKCADRLPTRL